MVVIVRNVWRDSSARPGHNPSRPADDLRAGAECVFSCGEGWRVVALCCRRIETALEKHGGSFRFQRVSEIQGAMRIVWGGRLSPAAAASVREVIDLAEARSFCVCEECGERGRLHCSEGVMITRCPDHARGKRALRPDQEDLHLRQKVIKGRLSVVVASRYDFATDSFVDLDPFADLGGL
jgi:hypothetical protein